jgi:ComEC/Rec2-related protein
VWACALLCLGCVVGRDAVAIDPLAPLAAAMAALVVALLTRGWTCRGALALAMVLFGAGWIGVRTRTVDPLATWVRDVPSGAVVTVEGLVTGPVRRQAPGRGALGMAPVWGDAPREVFEVDVRAVLGGAGLVPARGEVLVRVTGGTDEGDAAPASQGSWVRVTGVYEPIEGPLNPGEPDRRLWAAQRGRVGTLDVSAESLVEPAHGAIGAMDRFRAAGLRVVGALRARSVAALDGVAGPGDVAGDDDSPGHARAVLGVLLLGQREPGLEGVEGAFARSGLVHVLAISGFHLAVLAWGVLWAVRLTGEHPRIEALGVGGVIVAYLLVVPAEAPVLRCGVTLLVYLVVHASGRRYDRLNTLAWVAVGLVLWRPLDLWSPGFQLSFGVVAALLHAGDATTDRLFGTPLRIGGGVRAGAGIHPRARGPVGQFAMFVLGHVKTLVASSLLCWAVATPLVAYHAGWVSPLAPLTSLVVVPLAALLLCVGYAALLVGVAWPWLGSVVAGPARWLADALAAGVVRLDQSAWSSVPLPALGAWWAAAATLAAVLVFSWRLRPRWPAWGALAMVTVWFAGECVLRGRLGSDVAVRIDTIAVGDGTCHVVRSRRPGARWWERDEVLLWDAGSLRGDIGVRDLPRALRHAGGGGVWSAPTVLVTHPNLDHYVAVPDLVRPLGVRRVLMTTAFVRVGEARPESGPGRLMRALEDAGVEVRTLGAGDVFALGSSTAEVLWPPEGRAFIADNDTSLVVRFVVDTSDGARTLVLTGDIGREGIAGVMARHEDGVHADVLEAPHHGSFNDLAAEFIVRADPEVVLQSTGPRRAMDRRLDPLKGGRAWYTTATDGAAWAEILTDGRVRSGSLRRREPGAGAAVTPGGAAR